MRRKFVYASKWDGGFRHQPEFINQNKTEKESESLMDENEFTNLYETFLLSQVL